MSQANIPNITPTISLSLTQTIPLLFNSIALEELALAHLINAEAEKTQFALGTLTSAVSLQPPVVSLTDLINVNKNVQRTLQDVIKKEMLLEFQFENILSALPITTPCNCTATNQAGNDFNITRGNPGRTYEGHMCLGCVLDNTFTFTYAGNTAPAFIFTATTFNIPPCPNHIVEITGQGTTNNPDYFGPSVSYTLTLNGVMNNKSITLMIEGSLNSFTTTDALGNGELTVDNCI